MIRAYLLPHNIFIAEAGSGDSRVTGRCVSISTRELVPQPNCPNIVPRRFESLLVFLAGVMLCCSPPRAEAQPYPGKSAPDYRVELEPHLVLQWTRGPYGNDDGVGVGLRAAIPVLDNGPLPNFPNNLAVSFGLDWVHFDGCGHDDDDDCGADSFLIPVAVQWNFWVTSWLSLFPELGLAIEHASWDWEGPGDCGPGPGPDDCDDGSDTDVELVLWIGARFAVSRDVAVMLRLGTPSVLIGVSFFF